MLLSRIAPLGALLILSTTAGCALTTHGEETTTSTEALTSETFTLYSDVEPNLSGRCDIHTVLTLSRGSYEDVKEPFARGSILDAHLYDEALGGYCAVKLDPVPRDYVLLLDGEECGSLIYKAGGTVNGRNRDLTLTDHRKRFCKDVVPARIIVEERQESGDIRTLYALDRKPVS